ncbi:glucose-methanol-choline oxidoreductase, partial [Mycena capillaripes]
HHGCCTNKMGAGDDNEAVLDGRFRVGGVSSLRVVDMSSWPDAPGFFPTTPTYMLSEKAADLILQDTQRY